ncbi:MAG: hypothetical protein KME03_10075 [Aphanocapsa lilacina HA4352-LM1]|jgi:hypothetical protein|nr:hypothetical protein [Aphanocapsa lilacina HA4352-LM1]
MLRAQQYVFDVGPGQMLVVSLQGEQTVLSLQSGSVGQQQSQQSGFPTGAWLVEPQAWQSHGTVRLRIQSQRGCFWLQVGHGQIGAGSPPPQDALPVPSRAVSGPPRTRPAEPTMRPMAPVPPIKPMEMQMGNMAMRMGGEPPSSDLQAENLRLREENLRLREEVLALREQLWQQRQGQ